jgi:hypothetical protein
MDESQLRLIRPGMDVDDVDGKGIGPVAHVHWAEGAPLSEGVLEVKTGLLGLGKHLRIPMSAVEGVVVHADPSTALPAGGGDVILSKSRAEIEQPG